MDDNILYFIIGIGLGLVIGAKIAFIGWDRTRAELDECRMKNRGRTQFASTEDPEDKPK